MRIWSIHPIYLDAKGLVALWRETLLARHVLLGKTKGYKNHPQLNRFKQLADPVGAIDQYLYVVYQEAFRRGYHFDSTKFNWDFDIHNIPVTSAQLEYEFDHLREKLKLRDRSKYNFMLSNKPVISHSIFTIVSGSIESWEKR